jgi:hypothetical protein
MARNPLTLGCTSREVTVYLALRGVPPKTGAEIAAICGLYPETVRSVLVRAVKAGNIVRTTPASALCHKYALTAAGHDLSTCCYTPALLRMRDAVRPMAGVRSDECLYRADCDELSVRLDWPVLSCSECQLRRDK